MLIKEKLIAESEARLKKGKVDVSKLDRELGDGPLKLSEEQKQRRMRQLLGETNDPVSARVGLERIINGNDLDNINYLAKGIAASHPVCRIQLKDSGGNLVGYASGFLIGPGVLIGRDCVIGPNVVIGFSLLGDKVSISAGAVLGEAGFGAAPGGCMSKSAMYG